MEQPTCSIATFRSSYYNFWLFLTRTIPVNLSGYDGLFGGVGIPNYLRMMVQFNRVRYGVRHLLPHGSSKLLIGANTESIGGVRKHKIH